MVLQRTSKKIQKNAKWYMILLIVWVSGQELAWIKSGECQGGAGHVDLLEKFVLQAGGTEGTCVAVLAAVGVSSELSRR